MRHCSTLVSNPPKWKTKINLHIWVCFLSSSVLARVLLCRCEWVSPCHMYSYNTVKEIHTTKYNWNSSPEVNDSEVDIVPSWSQWLLVMTSVQALRSACDFWRPVHLNEDDSLSLEQITNSFSAPITEEHAFAIIYECCKTLKNVFQGQRSKCAVSVVSSLRDIFLHRDGRVHETTFRAPKSRPRRDSVDRNLGRHQNIYKHFWTWSIIHRLSNYCLIIHK